MQQQQLKMLRMKSLKIVTSMKIMMILIMKILSPHIAHVGILIAKRWFGVMVMTNASLSGTITDVLGWQLKQYQLENGFVKVSYLSTAI